MNDGSLSKYTFMMLLHRIMEIGENFTVAIPGVFALVIDGWTKSNTHCLSVFAAYPKERTQKG